MSVSTDYVVVGILVGTFSTAIVIIYALYKLESKMIALIERGIIKPINIKKNEMPEQLFIVSLLLIFLGVGFLVPILLKQIILVVAVLPISEGFALIIYYIHRYYRKKNRESTGKVNDYQI